MKIRTKIALWIIGSGVFTSLVLSSVVFFELVEQYYEVMDQDLASISSDVGDLSSTSRNIDVFLNAVDMFPGSQRYWINIYTAEKKSIWRTSVARGIDIPFSDKEAPFTFHTKLPPSIFYPDMDDDDTLAFRVTSNTFEIDGTSYILRIGKPMEDPESEFLELTAIIAVGLCVAVLTLIVLSGFFAGRILKPISDISQLATEINDRTLDQRIPVRQSNDEFSHLSKTLNNMFDRLQFSFEKQKRLLSDASHELKSPITLLRLQIEERLQIEDLSEEHENQLVKQQETLHRLSRMITSLLDLSALEIEQHLEMVDILLSDLVTPVLNDFDELLHAAKVTARTEVPISLRFRGDVEKIRRVIVNLVENAIKYNHEGGRLTIGARVEKSHIHLSVYNTGTGIPEKDLPRVFDQFYRVETSRSPLYGGTGLGLTIVKSIVELHGGRIVAHSRFGEWTRIDVYLPLNTK